jgi:hypothetical protein
MNFGDKRGFISVFSTHAHSQNDLIMIIVKFFSIARQIDIKLWIPLFGEYASAWDFK